MTREKQINNEATNYGYAVAGGCIERGYIQDAFENGAQWADQHPSDETIMLILNCIGYEEKNWIEFVRKELEKRK